MEVGNVNSKHFVLALKVKSVLDPCEDENDDNQSDNASFAADSARRDDSDFDSEFSHSDDDQYIVAPIEKEREQQNAPILDEDDTQDPAEDELQLGRVKDWISAHHLDKIELTDVLSHFPNISLTLIKEIMEKLVREGAVSKTGTDSYSINKQKIFNYEFDAVKEEMDCHVGPKGHKSQNGMGADYMYMKALYHALPMNYVTVAKLQSKLEGEANQPTVHKLIDKITQDGFAEAKSNCRLGKRVIHSHLTEKKLIEVRRPYTKILWMWASMNQITTTGTCPHVVVSSQLDQISHKQRGAYQNGSIRSDRTISKRKDHRGTPTSRAEPVASRESFVPGNENGSGNKDPNNCDQFDNIICSRSSQDKRSRKASTVKEPILQYVKRQKSQAA